MSHNRSMALPGSLFVLQDAVGDDADESITGSAGIDRAASTRWPVSRTWSAATATTRCSATPRPTGSAAARAMTCCSAAKATTPSTAGWATTGCSAATASTPPATVPRQRL